MHFTIVCRRVVMQLLLTPKYSCKNYTSLFQPWYRIVLNCTYERTFGFTIVFHELRFWLSTFPILQWLWFWLGTLIRNQQSIGPKIFSLLPLQSLINSKFLANVLGELSEHLVNISPGHVLVPTLQSSLTVNNDRSPGDLHLYPTLHSPPRVVPMRAQINHFRRRTALKDNAQIWLADPLTNPISGRPVCAGSRETHSAKFQPRVEPANLGPSMRQGVLSMQRIGLCGGFL